MKHDEDWAKEFVKTFYVYNLKTGTPAGAEKEAVAFIRAEKQLSYERGYNNGHSDGWSNKK